MNLSRFFMAVTFFQVLCSPLWSQEPAFKEGKWETTFSTQIESIPGLSETMNKVAALTNPQGGSGPSTSNEADLSGVKELHSSSESAGAVLSGLFGVNGNEVTTTSCITKEKPYPAEQKTQGCGEPTVQWNQGELDYEIHCVEGETETHLKAHLVYSDETVSGSAKTHFITAGKAMDVVTEIHGKYLDSNCS